jgi:hypothetical protein
MAVTLQSMKCYATVYLLYTSVGGNNHNNNNVNALRRTLDSGLKLLVAFHAPQSSINTSIVMTLLASLQVVALQLAHLKMQEEEDRTKFTLQAARFASWQLDWCTLVEDPNMAQQRLPMLSRLAESLCKKCASQTAEASLLYLLTLAHQNKWQEIIEYTSAGDGDDTNNHIPLT